MTIDPVAQFSLCLWAFLGGLAFGLLGEVGKVVRILVGAYVPPPALRARYERPLPLIGRAPRFRKTAPRRAWAGTVQICADIAFPVLVALYVLYILFRFQNGIFRASAVLLFLIGLSLFRVGLSRHFIGPMAAFAYALCALGVYGKVLLLFPPTILWRFLKRFLLLPLLSLWRATLASLCQKRTQRLCAAQRALALEGLDKTSKRNKKLCRKKEKRVAASRP